MARNLDMTALRSFVSVADTGGVTRAANMLNLTQSAVSMQLKRLEESLGQTLFDRTGRTIALSSSGDQLLGYARRLIALNDEAWGQMTNAAFEGELNLGIPHDLIYPHIPRILQRFASAYPRVRVNLHSLYTSVLKVRLDRGEMDVILCTEASLDKGGETLNSSNLVWIGAEGGQAWRRRPVRIATISHCLFRRPMIEALEKANLPWESAVESISETAIDASVTADLAINAQLAGVVPRNCEPVRHGGTLPPLPVYQINLYERNGPRKETAEMLADFVRQAYRVPDRVAAE